MDCGMIKRIIILPISVMLMGELCRLSFSHTQFINSRTNSLLHSPTFPPWGLRQGNISTGQKGRSPVGRAAGSQGCCLFSAEQRGCAGRRLDNLAHLFTSMKQMSIKPLSGLCGELSLIKEEGFSFLINYMFTHTHTHGAFLFSNTKGEIYWKKNGPVFRDTSLNVRASQQMAKNWWGRTADKLMAVIEWHKLYSKGLGFICYFLISLTNTCWS